MTNKTNHKLTKLQVGDLFIPTTEDLYLSLLIVEISPTNSADIRQIKYCITRRTTRKIVLLNDYWHQRDVDVILADSQRFSVD